MSKGGNPSKIVLELVNYLKHLQFGFNIVLQLIDSTFSKISKNRTNLVVFEAVHFQSGISCYFLAEYIFIYICVALHIYVCGILHASFAFNVISLAILQCNFPSAIYSYHKPATYVDMSELAALCQSNFKVLLQVYL